MANILKQESCSLGFAAMPHEHMFVVAQLILDVATPDINKADEIRTTLKDIWDIRQSKLRWDRRFEVWMIRAYFYTKILFCYIKKHFSTFKMCFIFNIWSIVIIPSKTTLFFAINIFL